MGSVKENRMNKEAMIEDLIHMLDQGMTGGVGHMNVKHSADSPGELDLTGIRHLQTLGCTDCNDNPMACSVPTLQQGLDR
jgi:hypothetical protein